MSRPGQISRAGAIAPLAALFALLMLMLTACSSGTETASFTRSANGYTTTLTYYADADVVFKQETVSTVDYVTAGIESEEALKEQMVPVVQQFQGLEGVVHSIRYDATSATETLSVDFRVADMSKLAQLSGSAFTGEDEPVSLEMSRALLLGQGYAEQK